METDVTTQLFSMKDILATVLNDSSNTENSFMDGDGTDKEEIGAYSGGLIWLLKRPWRTTMTTLTKKTL